MPGWSHGDVNDKACTGLSGSKAHEFPKMLCWSEGKEVRKRICVIVKILTLPVRGLPFSLYFWEVTSKATESHAWECFCWVMLDSLTMRFTVGALCHVVSAQHAEWLETEINHVGRWLCLHDESPVKTQHTKHDGSIPVWQIFCMCFHTLMLGK